MNQYRITTQYPPALIRIVLVAISFLLGYGAVTATHAHGVEADTGIHADHALMVEGCTVADSSAPYAGPVPSAHYAVMTGVGTVIHLEPDARVTLASAAPAPDASLLRLLYQVFLN